MDRDIFFPLAMVANSRTPAVDEAVLVDATLLERSTKASLPPPGTTASVMSEITFLLSTSIDLLATTHFSFFYNTIRIDPEVNFRINPDLPQKSGTSGLLHHSIILVYDTNTICVLMHSYGRTDLFV